MGLQVNTGAGGLGVVKSKRESIWSFQFGLPRDINLLEAKTTKEQTTLKRTDPAFIEPMQCQPVTTLPSGETRNSRD